MRLVTISMLVLCGVVYPCRANTDVAANGAVMRTWTCGNGMVVTGQLVSVTNGLVTLGLPGGMRKIIALAVLCSQDVGYLSSSGAVKPAGPVESLPPTLRDDYEQLKRDVARMTRLNDVGRVSAKDAAAQIQQVVSRFTNNYWSIDASSFPARTDSHCQALLQELGVRP